MLLYRLFELFRVLYGSYNSQTLPTEDTLLEYVKRTTHANIFGYIHFLGRSGGS